MPRTATKALTPRRKNWGTRLEAIASPAFKRAFTAARAKYPTRKSCAQGHRLTNPKNVDVGDLMRTGRLNCHECWLQTQARYLTHQKSAKVVNGKAKHPASRTFSIAIPSDAAMKLKEVLSLARNRYNTLPDNTHQRHTWMQNLIGMLMQLDGTRPRTFAPVEIPTDWQRRGVQVGAA